MKNIKGIFVGCVLVLALGHGVARAAEPSASLDIAPTIAIQGDDLPQALGITLTGLEPQSAYEFTLRARSSQSNSDYGSFWHPSSNTFSTSYEQLPLTDQKGDLHFNVALRFGGIKLEEGYFRLRVRLADQQTSQIFDLGSFTVISIDATGTLQGTAYNFSDHTAPLSNAIIVVKGTIDGQQFQQTVFSEPNNINEGSSDLDGWVIFHPPAGIVEFVSAVGLDGGELTLWTQQEPPWVIKTGLVTTWDIAPVRPIPNLIISEFLPDPAPPQSDTTDEWFELYNAGSVAASTEGVMIRDLKGATTTKFLPLVSIPPGGFAIFTRAQVPIVQNNDAEGLELLFGDQVIDATPISPKALTGQSYARDLKGEWDWTSTSTPGAVNMITRPVIESAPPPPAARELDAIVMVGPKIIGSKTIVLKDQNEQFIEAHFTKDPPVIAEGMHVHLTKSAYHFTASGRITIDDNTGLTIIEQLPPLAPVPFDKDAGLYIPLVVQGTITSGSQGLSIQGIELQHASDFGLKAGQTATLTGFLRPYQDRVVFVVTAATHERATKPKKQSAKQSGLKIEAETIIDQTINAASNLAPSVLAAETASARPPPHSNSIWIFVLLGLAGAGILFRGHRYV